jgi:hypothetical protein
VSVHHKLRIDDTNVIKGSWLTTVILNINVKCSSRSKTHLKTYNDTVYASAQNCFLLCQLSNFYTMKYRYINNAVWVQVPRPTCKRLLKWFGAESVKLLAISPQFEGCGVSNVSSGFSSQQVRAPTLLPMPESNSPLLSAAQHKSFDLGSSADGRWRTDLVKNIRLFSFA